MKHEKHHEKKKSEHEHVKEHMQHKHVMHLKKEHGAMRVRANAHKSED